MLQRIKSILGIGKVAKEDIATSKTFCMMPWVHLHVTQYGTVTPCCQAPWDEANAFGNINKQSIEDIWNSKGIKEFRKTLAKDQRDTRCNGCYVKEEANLYSLREATNEYYLHHFDRVINMKGDGSIDAEPVYFDIRFSNFCNFKCRICGPWSSSSWFREAEELGWVEGKQRLTQAVEDEDAFFEQFKKYLPHIEEIYFAGGEPLMMDQHYRILDMLLEAGLTNTYLRYKTNFSTFSYKGKDIIEDYWKKFTNIFLCASLDDNHARGEIQRKGQNWNKVLDKRKLLMQECPHIDFMLAPTVSILNVFNLPAFHREWTELGLVDVSAIFPSLLMQPEHYNIKAMPADMKARVTTLYNQHYKWIMAQPTTDEFVRSTVANEFLRCIDYMNAEDMSSYLPALKQQSIAIDALRSENLADDAPELKTLLQ